MEIEERYNLELITERLDNPANNVGITAEAWTKDIRTTLRTVEGTKVGLMLLQSIKASGKWAKVMPYWWAGNDIVGVPRERAAVTHPIVEVKGPRAYMATMLFTPSLYGMRTPREARQKKKRGETLKEPHEVMFHELVHVLRMVTGQRLPEGGDPLGGGLAAHNNVEEFIGVLVTNIYASSNRKTAFRGGHFTDAGDLPDEFEGSFSFFKMGARVFPLIQEFCTVNKEFCQKISKAEAAFNPIKAFFDDPDKARKLSESARAKKRDALGDTYKMIQAPFMMWGYEGFEKMLAE